MVVSTRKPIGQILKEMDLVTEAQIQEALETQKTSNGALGQIMIQMGLVTADEMLFALGAQAGMEVVNLDVMNIPGDVIAMVDVMIANMYRVVPLEVEDGILTVAMADPLNVSILDELNFMLNMPVKGAVSNPDAVDRALARYYADQRDDVDVLMRGLDDEFADFEDGAEGMDVETALQSAPVVKLLNLVLMQAIKDQASDIHFEPFESDFKLRYRIDGVLYEMKAPPPHLAAALISRIKVMAKLDISENRVPQDGKISLSIAGRPVDLRISTLPTMFGESVVIRVLDRGVLQLDLKQVGMNDEEMEAFNGLIHKPNGIILVTGPTGSGKTTTLYSALRAVNTIDRKIITTEDPVEYNLDGIMQIQINEDIDVTFASCLRSILRQDPDMILVGEIRDLETAQISIQASLTGHVVFSTLHTNDAPSSITRLLDLGIEPFLIAATLEAIIAQRLVRKICTKCRTEYTPSEEMLETLGLEPGAIKEKTFFYGKGCLECNHTGYRGRTAIFEMLVADDKIKEMIANNASTEEIRDAAEARGMRNLRERGIRLIYEGITTVEEVVRETLLSS